MKKAFFNFIVCLIMWTSSLAEATDRNNGTLQVFGGLSIHCLIASPYPFIGFGCERINLGMNYHVSSAFKGELSYSQLTEWTKIDGDDYKSLDLDIISVTPKMKAYSIENFDLWLASGIWSGRVSEQVHGTASNQEKEDRTLSGLSLSFEIVGRFDSSYRPLAKLKYLRSTSTSTVDFLSYVLGVEFDLL